MEKRRIILLGATGYTGSRVLAELLARGERPALAGRSRARMTALAEKHHVDLPVITVDATSAADLSRLFGPRDVVVSTVGPFLKLGLPAATAAAEAGAHYLDSTGEALFVRRVFELDSLAAARGSTMVPAFGYDFVPGNLAGALALNKAGGQARHVEIGYFLTRSGHHDELQYRGRLWDAYAMTSGGTRATLAASSGQNTLAFRPPATGGPGAVVEERVGKRVLSFEYAGVNRAAMTVGGSEHYGLPEVFPGLESIDVGLGWFGRWTRVVQPAAAVAALLIRLTKSGAVLARLADRLPGAGHEPDGGGRSLIIAVARDGAGNQLATAALTGPEPYTLTASLLAWGAAHAAASGTPGLAPGVHGPVAAFGLATLLQGAVQAGLSQAPQA